MSKKVSRRVARDSDEETENATVIPDFGTETVTVEKMKDSFGESAEVIKKYAGVTPTLKRGTTRKLNKAASLVTVESATNGRENLTDELTGYDMFQVVVPPHQLEYLAAVYDISSYYHGAVDALVSNTVGLGYHFEASPRMKYELEKEDQPNKIEKMRQKLTRTRAMLEEWIDTLNTDDSLQEILEKVMTDYYTTGNGYIEVGRTVEGPIEYIGHIPSATMRVRRKRDGFVQVVGRRAVFFRNFGDQETTDPIGGDSNPNEIIHIKNYSPANTYYGVPDVYSAKKAIAGNEYSADFNLDYFENKAVPRYIVTLKNAVLDSKSERRLLEFFEVGLKGKGNSHRTLYVPLKASDPDNQPEIKFDAIESGKVDSSFHQYRMDNRDEILFAMRVPINKLGLPQGVSLAAGRDASKGFKEEVCQPSQNRIEKKLNKIFSEKTDALVLRLDQLTLTDDDTQSKIDERYLRMQTITPNEVRDGRGMPSVPWGDKPVELKPQQSSESTAQASGNRTRDQQRSANSPDTSGEGRNSQGDGRAAP
jgi:PBSX family phage portal protein